MQTEIKSHFNFTTKIDSDNGLELYYGNTRLTYDMLPDFISACKFKHDFKTVCVYVLKMILFVALSWLTPTIIAIEEMFF